MEHLSDLHADVHVLQDALHTIYQLNCDGIVCAGDVIDYGLFPDEVIGLLIQHNIPTIRGNHDRWALEKNRE